MRAGNKCGVSQEKAQGNLSFWGHDGGDAAAREVGGKCVGGCKPSKAASSQLPALRGKSQEARGQTLPRGHGAYRGDLRGLDKGVVPTAPAWLSPEGPLDTLVVFSLGRRDSSLWVIRGPTLGEGGPTRLTVHRVRPVTPPLSPS